MMDIRSLRFVIHNYHNDTLDIYQNCNFALSMVIHIVDIFQPMAVQLLYLLPKMNAPLINSLLLLQLIRVKHLSNCKHGNFSILSYPLTCHEVLPHYFEGNFLVVFLRLIRTNLTFNTGAHRRILSVCMPVFELCCYLIEPWKKQDPKNIQDVFSSSLDAPSYIFHHAPNYTKYFLFYFRGTLWMTYFILNKCKISK